VNPKNLPEVTRMFLDEAKRTRDLAVLDMKYGHQHLDAILQRAIYAIEILLGEVERIEASAWRPMKTAPRDGSEILLFARGKFYVAHYMPGGHCIEDHPPIDEGWYFNAGSMFDKAMTPMAWLPLPQPPKGAA